MPIIEFICDECKNQFSKILSFREVSTDGTPNGPVNENLTRPCTVCGKDARRIPFSVPLGAHLYGNPDGYHKPSPTKRYSYKLASPKGNAGSAG